MAPASHHLALYRVSCHHQLEEQEFTGGYARIRMTSAIILLVHQELSQTFTSSRLQPVGPSVTAPLVEFCQLMVHMAPSPKGQRSHVDYSHPA